MAEKHTFDRIGWFLPLRLAHYIVLFAVVVLWMSYPRFMQPQFIIYSACTLLFSILLALGNKHNLKNVTAVVIGLQFLFEIVLESGIIYSTGNVNSPFSALFILTIVAAALIYRLLGTLVIASLVSVAYTFIIWLGLSSGESHELSIQTLRTVFSTDESVFYSIFLHILIFYLVAFISGYLAERLKQRDRQLEDTSLALKKAKLETDDILRHLNSGLLTIDSSGCIIYFNRAAERILGYKEEDVKGMHCEEAFAERMPGLARRLMDGIENHVEHPRVELEIVNTDGKVVPLGLSTSILTQEAREMRGIIAIFSDLTEAKRLEAKMRTADRLAAVGELSASIAHEIRNPLAAIAGSVEVLKKDVQVSGEDERLMNLIIKESDRLTNILTEFLSYARIDRAAYNKVELCHLVSDVIEMLYHHRDLGGRADFKIESEESFVYVVGDEDLIKQLLLNLAVNACESFEGDAGQVVFRFLSDRQNNKILLHIHDNGPGIKPEYIKKIYQPFFSTKKEGTGLGLSIVHRICTALKLKVDVHSEPGKGTTFIVEFDIYAPEPPTQSETSPELTANQ
ncbi:MAG: PAS domain S-box protein [Candidatus Zixiibacteriota bacterium]|nr:MAG: PAS domain S-box protein [candidate division Zixibacteria bacterium]